MESIVERVTIISGSLSFFLLLGEITTKGNLPWRLYLIIIYSSHSFFMFLGWAIFSQNPNYAANLIIFSGPVMLLHAWVLPRSFRCITNLCIPEELKRDFFSVTKDLSVPIFFFVITIIVFYLNFENRLQSFESIMSNSNMRILDYYSPAILVFALLYQIYGLIITMIRAASRYHEKQIKVIMILSGILILRTMFGLTERIFFRNSHLDLHFLTAGIMIPIFFLIYKQYLSFLQKNDFDAFKSYKQSRLSEVNLSDLENNLQKAMEVDRLFTKDSLTIAELANHTKVTIHQLSEYLNVNKKTSFRQFINEWRIDFACELLRSYPEKTVIQIAFECGFNAKSTFHTAFQKHKKVHPTEYRQKILSVHKKT
ncbi:helix-turn-helix transcriptional regulator [Leptospira sp. 96542]|nr:helix-turn-helix transcriptional regulator [Leptospira sp. 96542]